MKAIIGLFFAAFIPWVQADESIHCNPEGSNQEMAACAYQEFARVDQELNSVYQQLLAKYRDNPLFIEKMKGSQRAWLKFRDAELEAIFPCEESDVRICWGSLYLLEYPLEKKQLTEDRIAQLRYLLDRGFGS